jgi:hypothetical protein
MSMARLPKLIALGGAAAAAAITVVRRRGTSAGDRKDGAEPQPLTATTPPPDPATVQGVADPVAVTSHTPPLETPGPSVTPPRRPESETERAERADALKPDPELLRDRAGGPVDELVEAETNAAAAEAAAIGGSPGSRVADDPAMQPVYEAGGGEQEGFEEAEADLIENASHGDGRGNPEVDAPRPELESDRSTATYGEPDEEDSTEVVRDPEAGKTPTERRRYAEDDPGEGPGITDER